MATDQAWRATLSNILESTEQNLRIAALGSGTYPPTLLSKVVEHNYSCDASAARSEFSSLLNTVQGSLAELKLEVAAARQLSAQVSANLPQNHDSFLDLHQHGQAWTPQRPVKAISSVHTSRQEPRQTTLQVQRAGSHAVAASISELAQITSCAQECQAAASSQQTASVSAADTAHLRQQVQQLTAAVHDLQAGRIAAEVETQSLQASCQQLSQSLEQALHQGAEADQSLSIAHILTRLEASEAKVQRLHTQQQAHSDDALQQQFQRHMLSWQEQELPRQLQPFTDQAHQLKAASHSRMDVFEVQLHAIASTLGLPVRQASTQQSVASPEPAVSPVLQQLHDLHSAIALLAQAQQHSTAQPDSQAASHELQHSIAQLRTDVKQLQDTRSSLQQGVLDLQKGMSAQQAESAQMQQQCQQLSTDVQGLKAADQHQAQHDHASLQAQLQSSAEETRQQLAEQQAKLDSLGATFAATQEEVQAQADLLAQQQVHVKASTEEQSGMQVSLQRLQQQVANAGKDTDKGGVHHRQHTDDTKQEACMQERLGSLEAEQAHQAAASEAMSSIIDQVAQLGEQQVQGCTLRVGRLEDDLAQRTDSLRQQHDAQASALASLTALVSSLQNSPGPTVQESADARMSAAVAELQARVGELQGVSTDSALIQQSQQELGQQLATLQSHVGQLQLAGDATEHTEHVAELRSRLKELQFTVEAMDASAASHSQLASRVDDMHKQLGVLQSGLAQVDGRSNTADAVSQLSRRMERLDAQLGPLQAAAASDTRHAKSAGVEADLSALKAQLAQLQSRAADQAAMHTQLTRLSTDVAQLQASAKSHDPHSSVIELKQDVQTLRSQLSQLQAQSASQGAKDSWQKDVQGLKADVTHCAQAADRTEAAVAQHTAQLQQAEQHLSSMQKELAAVAANQAVQEIMVPTETHRGHTASAEAADAEDWNARLFEMRVELQNLADDTNISIASIGRKAELAEQHAEEAAEAAAALKHTLLQLQPSAQRQPQTPPHILQQLQAPTPTSPSTPSQPPSTELLAVKQQAETQQAGIDKLSKQCAELHTAMAQLQNMSDSQSKRAQQAQQELAGQVKAAQAQLETHARQLQTAQAQHAQHEQLQQGATQWQGMAIQVKAAQAQLDKHAAQLESEHAQHQELQQAAVHWQEVAGQVKAAQARLDSHALQGAAQEQQQEAQHAESKRQIQTLQQQAQHSTQQSAAQCSLLQQELGRVKATLADQAVMLNAFDSKCNPLADKLKALEQADRAQPQQQLNNAQLLEMKSLSSANQTQQQQLVRVQSQLDEVRTAVATASSTAGASCGKLEQQVAALQAEVAQAQHAQHDFQAAQQHSAVLEGQLHALAAEQAELTARHAQVGGPAGEQPSAAEAALKQRLRKVELTVAALTLLTAQASIILGAKICQKHVKTDALVEVASQMKTLEAKVSSLTSPLSSPESQPSAARSTVPSAASQHAAAAAAPSRIPAYSNSHAAAAAAVSATLRADQHPAQSTMLQQAPSMVPQQVGGTHHISKNCTALPAGRAVASSAPTMVPDLMLFSPAVKTVPDAAAASSKPMAMSMNEQQAVQLHSSATDAGSQAVSPQPAMSLFDDAVFGSPTPPPTHHGHVLGSPTPTPPRQASKVLPLGPEHSLLSPGSSPEQPPQQPRQQQPMQQTQPQPTSQQQQQQQQRALAAQPPGLLQQAQQAQSHLQQQGQQRAGSSKRADAMSASPAVPQFAQHGSRALPGRAPSHSPNISLGANFQAGMHSLLDDTDADSASADEEEVAHQIKVINEQLARHDVDEWERDILTSELNLLKNLRGAAAAHT